MVVFCCKPLSSLSLQEFLIDYWSSSVDTNSHPNSLTPRMGKTKLAPVPISSTLLIVFGQISLIHRRQLILLGIVGIRWSLGRYHLTFKRQQSMAVVSSLKASGLLKSMVVFREMNMRCLARGGQLSAISLKLTLRSFLITRSKSAIITTMDKRGKKEAVVKQRFQGENLQRRMIIDLEKYNHTYEEEVNGIKRMMAKMEKASLANKNSLKEAQLYTTKQEVESIVKVIAIKRKELAVFKRNEMTRDKLEEITEVEMQVRKKSNQLQILKREVKQLDIENKKAARRVENLRLKASKPPKELGLMRLAISENKFLKMRISDIAEREGKTRQRMKTQAQSISLSQSRVTTFPDIHQTKKERVKSLANFELVQKLNRENEVYTRWIGIHKPSANIPPTEEMTNLETKNQDLKTKINTKQHSISQLRGHLKHLKSKVPPGKVSPKKVEGRLKVEERVSMALKVKHWQGGIVEEPRQQRKDWVGGFNSCRFSDSRGTCGQSRLYRILHNDEGYYTFSYYSVNKDSVWHCPPPFDHQQVPRGQDKVFEVVRPDFIRAITVLIDTGIQRIAALKVTSDTGMVGEFLDRGYDLKAIRKSLKSGDGKFAIYSFNMQAEEIPQCLFGSYSMSYDNKDKQTTVFLQGLGVDLIQEESDVNQL